jgi:hypothetical protein
VGRTEDISSVGSRVGVALGEQPGRSSTGNGTATMKVTNLSGVDATTVQPAGGTGTADGGPS